LRRLFWATDRFSLTEEVMLAMCKEIAHNKKKRRLEQSMAEESQAIGSNIEESVASEGRNTGVI
jgi:hypothetical protein